MELLTTNEFRLEIDGVTLGSFKEVKGLTTETEVVEYKECQDGKVWIRKAPGAFSYGDIELARCIDDSHTLWEWRKQVLDGGVEEARKTGSIVLVDHTGDEQARWNFENGWPSEWSGAELDADSNEVATERVKIVHTRLWRD